MSNKALNFITQLTRDIVNLLLSFFLVIWIAPLHTQEPIEKYFLPYLCFTLAWILVAIIMGRYKVPIKEQGYITLGTSPDYAPCEFYIEKDGKKQITDCPFHKKDNTNNINEDEFFDLFSVFHLKRPPLEVRIFYSGRVRKPPLCVRPISTSLM